ncbi:MAG: thioredoxin family protein [Candidatus Izemoplasmatales bacterium]|nr:thioredoxin family protein [Acholeplasmataceae bacterium]
MEIKVYGSGCANCKKLLDNVERACRELSFNAKVDYVTDTMEIVNAGLMRTPGLMMNGKIVAYGRVPNVEEIKKLIEANQ